MKTIIYVGTKALATTLWEILCWSGKVAIHHSSLTYGTKRQTEEDFRAGKVTVVIATIGFGMVPEPSDNVFVNLNICSRVST